VTYPTPATPSSLPPVPYSDWLHRAGGFLIDYVPILILVIIAIAIGHVFLTLVIDLVAIAVWGYNRWFLGGSTGQSWGRKALGLRLVSEETGQPIGTAMSFVRDICHFLDSLICYIGWLFPLWDSKRQTLADKIIRTVVVPA
jgi:uncharacterized RDD family membrane protein YckC